LETVNIDGLMKRQLTKQRCIIPLLTILLLIMGCIPPFPSVLPASTPTQATLNIPGIVQIQPPKPMFVGGLIWSPNSDKLALSYSRLPAEPNTGPSIFQIQILDIDSHEMHLIEESNAGWRSVTAWLADDRLAFYASGDLQEGTWLMPANGVGPKTLAAPDIVASWAPNGRDIAYWRSEQEAQTSSASIFIRDLNGGDERQVFDLQEKFTSEGILRWANDGDQLLFTIGTSAISRDEIFRNTNIHRLDLETGHATQLTKSGYYGYVAWSPDEKLIAYTYQDELSSQTPQALYIMRSDGTCSVQIVEGQDQSFGGLGWSPDGRWIAFSWNQGIYLLDTFEGEVIAVLKNDPTCASP
jgi:Tol biopolymer transport system component